MIQYVTSRRMQRPMREFLAGPGRRLAKRITVIPYPALFRAEWPLLPRGTWIFTGLGTDLGSLDPPSSARAAMARLHEFLVAREGPGRVLNHPTRYLPRRALLATLQERGINGFGCWRARDPHAELRFPVFLRPEHGSVKTPPRLLQDRAALEPALGQAAPGDDLLAIEFLDTADRHGIYRKFGAFIVGGRIVPRHVFFSRQWHVKSADLVEPPQLEEELGYLETNPHAGVLQAVSRIAGLAYGRIDYAVLGGAPQVWEINVTPALINPPGSELPAREVVTQRFATAFADALEALDESERA